MRVNIVEFKTHFVYSHAGSDEQKFLEASMAYVSGKPIMNDKEYDKLKMQLKVGCYKLHI